MVSENPLRKPVNAKISEDMVSALVSTFYTKIRSDDVLGPIFACIVGDDWGPHLAKMCDFWSSVMMMSGRYKGNPMIAHMRLKLVKPEHFGLWLALFRETALEVCPPDVATLFCARAGNIAHSLQLGMYYRPTTPSTHSAPHQGVR